MMRSLFSVILSLSLCGLGVSKILFGSIDIYAATSNAATGSLHCDGENWVLISSKNDSCVDSFSFTCAIVTEAIAEFQLEIFEQSKCQGIPIAQFASAGGRGLQEPLSKPFRSFKWTPFQPTKRDGGQSQSHTNELELERHSSMDERSIPNGAPPPTFRGPAQFVRSRTLVIGRAVLRFAGFTPERNASPSYEQTTQLGQAIQDGDLSGRARLAAGINYAYRVIHRVGNTLTHDQMGRIFGWMQDRVTEAGGGSFAVTLTDTANRPVMDIIVTVDGGDN